MKLVALIFLIVAGRALISSFKAKKSDTIDLNIHDTYFVLSRVFLLRLAAGVLLAAAIIILIT